MSIRAAYSSWPAIDQALRDVVGDLTPEQLAIQPTPERWPLWATIGHLGCQRVSWLCGFLGEPGADATPWPNALYECPGDEDLEHVLDATQLVAGLTATFAIIERCLDTWTMDMLDEVVRRTFGTDEWAHTRGFVIQRVLAHDVSHITEINETLGRNGLRQVDLFP